LNTNFKVYDMTQPRTEPKYTDSVVDTRQWQSIPT